MCECGVCLCVFGGGDLLPSSQVGNHSNPSNRVCFACFPTAYAKNVCTFNSTGRNFVNQRVYACVTCSLIGNEGMCLPCARICHAGHRCVTTRPTQDCCCCFHHVCPCSRPRFGGCVLGVCFAVVHWPALRLSCAHLDSTATVAQAAPCTHRKSV